MITPVFRGMAATWDPQTHQISYARCRWCDWSKATDSLEAADTAWRVHALCCPWSRRHAQQQQRKRAA